MAPWRPAVPTVLALVLVGLGGCSSSGGSSPEGNEGGMGVPQQRPGESYPGARGPVDGAVALQSNGCFRIETAAGSRLVVWPRGTRQDPQDGAVLRLPSGDRLGDGDRVTGTGLELPVTGLPGVPDGYWGSVVTFCAPDDATVLVLDEVRPA